MPSIRRFLLMGIMTIALCQPVSVLAEPSMERQHIESAQGYMNAGQWDYANFEWRAALAENPDNVDAHIGLANSLMQGGYITDAIKHLKETRKSLHRLSLDLSYAQALERHGSFMEAERIYIDILNKVPLENETFERLLDLRAQLPEKHRRVLDVFLSRKASSAAKQGQAALAENDYNTAARYFGISTAYRPRSEDLNNYGVSLLLIGQYEEALEQFARFHSDQTAPWQFYANKALTNLGRGRAEAATLDIERAIGLCDDASQKPLLYNVLGFVYENQNRWPKAKTAYERALELNPHFTKARMNLAYILQKDMAYEQAIETYRRILRDDPKNTKVWNRLGFAYELAHKERQALSAYQEATDIQPDNQEAYYNLALLYRKMGKTRDADLAYKKLMSIEFQQMEAGTHQAASKPPKTTDTVRNPQVRLLDYVDVFFSKSG